MFDFVWNLLSFVVALSILVFVHEYGHFWVARKNGVKVIRFAIGFGKPIYRWFDNKGTEFVIGLIPLGGYVRMLDGRVDEVEPEQKSVSFDNKKVGQRIAIVAAGPIANFIFAAFVLVIMYLVGVPAIKPIVGDIKPESVAASAGLSKLDQITAVNNIPVSDWESTYYSIIEQVGKDQMELTVLRQQQTVKVNVDIQDWKVSDGDILSDLGFTPYRPKPLLTIAQVVDGSAAQRAGLRMGDKLVSIDDQPLVSWQQATEIWLNAPQQTLRFSVERQNQLLELSVVPELKQTSDGFSKGYLGVAPNVESWPKDYVFEHQYGIFPALQKSIEQTWAYIRLSFQMIGKLITGKIGLENLSGPISIAEGAGVSAQSGFIDFIKFLALISVNLGVVNLLPLPVLDGGHLMYFFIELIRGKPVSERVQDLGFRIGAFVLMMIMGIAIINDFGRL